MSIGKSSKKCVMQTGAADAERSDQITGKEWGGAQEEAMVTSLGWHRLTS